MSLPWMTTNAGGGGAMWVGANGAKAEVAAVDDVAVREAQIRGDRDSVQVSPRMPALERSQQICAQKLSSGR
jgi:hypothetical protein